MEETDKTILLTLPFELHTYIRLMCDALNASPPPGVPRGRPVTPGAVIRSIIWDRIAGESNG